MKLDKAEVVKARERLGLSIELLAKRAAVSKNSVSRAEHGLDIRPITARRIAHGLGLEVSDLYPKVEAPASSPEQSAAEEGAKKYRTPAGVEEAQEAIENLLSQYGVQVRYLTLPQEELEALYDAASSLEEAQEITDRIGLERGELAKYPDAQFPGTPTIAIMQSLLTALAGMHRVAEREEVVAGGDIERIEHIRATREQLAQNLELAAAS